MEHDECLNGEEDFKYKIGKNFPMMYHTQKVEKMRRSNAVQFIPSPKKLFK